MPGILELYVTHALDHINGHVAANTPLKISRATFELTLMRELDHFSFPIEYKLAWFHAILTSDHSTTFWLSTQLTHSLPPSCIARYTPDSSLLSLEDPPSTTTQLPTNDKCTPPPIPGIFPLYPSSTPDGSRNAMHDTLNGELAPLSMDRSGEDGYHADISSPQTVKKGTKKSPVKGKAKAMGGAVRKKPGPKKGFRRALPPKVGEEGFEKAKGKRGAGGGKKKGKGEEEKGYANGLGKSLTQLEPVHG